MDVKAALYFKFELNLIDILKKGYNKLKFSPILQNEIRACFWKFGEKWTNKLRTELDYEAHLNNFNQLSKLKLLP